MEIYSFVGGIVLGFIVGLVHNYSPQSSNYHPSIDFPKENAYQKKFLRQDDYVNKDEDFDSGDLL